MAFVNRPRGGAVAAYQNWGARRRSTVCGRDSSVDRILCRFPMTERDPLRKD